VVNVIYAASEGLWDSLLDGMGGILAFFYSLIPSYGVAIILLTVVVRLVLFPLTAKQARSMLKMQRAQPEIKRLQAKYKNDKQKMNEELMKFYKENSINPFGGCLPLVLQMPIFIALFSVLRRPIKHIPLDSTLYDAFCGTAQAAECKPKGLHFMGMDLSIAPSQASGGLINVVPYYILIALVVVTGYLQYRQTQARQGASAQANPQQAMIGKIFPVMFAFISFSLPAGVVLYFLVSNAWQIGQQAIIFGSLTPHAETTPDATPSPPPAAPQDGRAKGGGSSGTRPSAGRTGGDGKKSTGPEDGLGRAQPPGSKPRRRRR
jgi:YidC/Oxa1 family membrane protein insertase